MEQQIKIRFLGAASTVTGSKHLVEFSGHRILIDCGLFQGLKELRRLNWQPLPFDASKLQAVLLTHGHLDHVGYLPLLVKQGFRGKIYGTGPTLEIAQLILLDSAKIQEEDAAQANQFGYGRHEPAKPLYTETEAEKVFPLMQEVPTDRWINEEEPFSFRLRCNGHILGSTFIELKTGGRLLVFSGDIGRKSDPLLYPPQKPQQADLLVMESTYGDRLHPADAKNKLAEVVNRAAARKGTVIIPTFAVERAQLLMYDLWKLKNEQAIPDLPVYMDSPMGKHVLELFGENYSWHRLAPAECTQLCREIRIVRNVEETLKLAEDTAPKIILAAAGMATGGRVLTYFEQYIGRKTTAIILAGYQAEGTRGRALLEGAEQITIHGKQFEVRASVEMIAGLSAHADQSELVDWLSELSRPPEKLFIVHGEPHSSEALKKKLHEVYGFDSIIPELNEAFTLTAKQTDKQLND